MLIRNLIINLIYKQTYGTPMGSSLSPVIADIMLQDLEENVLSTLDLPIYYKYVDDFLLVCLRETLNDIQMKFNSYHERLKFTVKFEDNHHLNFLEKSLININNKIMID